MGLESFFSAEINQRKGSNNARREEKLVYRKRLLGNFQGITLIT